MGEGEIQLSSERSIGRKARALALFLLFISLEDLYCQETRGARGEVQLHSDCLTCRKARPLALSVAFHFA